MVFTSKEFLAFFLACVAGYFLLRPRHRWVLLLAASYFFYAVGEARFLVLLIAISMLAYLAGLVIESIHDTHRRKTLLVGAIVVLLIPLFVFKYLGFALDTADSIAQSGARPESLGFDIALPLGISFFTFQALSYVVDVYRAERPAERHPGILALFIAFFPQLIAGPIERADRLLPQFRKNAHPDAEAWVSGGRLILWGFFKKLVIADNLASYVDSVYSEPTAYNGGPLAVATVFFAFQIYCDFSAYVDIARGTARILGIDLMRNFNNPYGAHSIVEFWRRWHISLTTWFRDYVYVPLGGNRRGSLITARNVAIVFLLSGLWHGANWTFVVWGMLHGLALIALLWTAPIRARLLVAVGLDARPKLLDALGIAATFAFVCFAWIFFRADTLAGAWHVATHLFADVPGGRSVGDMIVLSDGSAFGFAGLSIFIASLFAAHLMPGDSIRRLFDLRPRWQRWGAYYALVFALLFWVGRGDAFIYFRF